MLSTRAHWRIQQKILDEYYLEYIDSAYAGLLWPFEHLLRPSWQDGTHSMKIVANTYKIITRKKL